MNLTRKLNQFATIWANPVADGYGGFTFSTPVKVSCRWEGTTQLVLNPTTGREVVSTASVWLNSDVSISEGGMLAEGDQTAYSSPYEAEGARTVILVVRVPDMKGTETVVRAML